LALRDRITEVLHRFLHGITDVEQWPAQARDNLLDLIQNCDERLVDDLELLVRNRTLLDLPAAGPPAHAGLLKCLLGLRHRGTPEFSWSGPRVSSSLQIYLHDLNDAPLLSAHQEKELAPRVALGDPLAREHMVKANLRLVVNIAREYLGKNGMSLEDLIEAGNLGLMRAVERFDGTIETRFSTYASDWIKQSIRQALTGHKNLEETGPGLDDVLTDDRDKAEETHQPKEPAVHVGEFPLPSQGPRLVGTEQDRVFSKSGRRRFVDPTTLEKDYTEAEKEFMAAMKEYKNRSGRMFPTWSEVLEVLRGLGYERPGPHHGGAEGPAAEGE
jgi:RNA polymerase sigma factor (sigma-70 family)